MREDITKKYGDNETIELVMSDDFREHHSSRDFLSFWADTIKQDEVEKLALFADYLSKVGIELKVTHIDNATGSRNLVSFAINYETFDKTLNRGAGRKKDFDMGNRYTKCTVSELKEKLDAGMKKSDIIAELHCPKSTFYRILKNLEESGLDFEEVKDSYIWYFTS